MEKVRIRDLIFPFVETLHAKSLLGFDQFLISGFYHRIWYD